MTGNGRDFSEGIKPARCGKCSAGGSGAFEEQRFDVLAFGEILIDFTFKGFNDAGMRLFSQNPGGAPANVAVAVSRLGLKSAFVGKVGSDMHGDFLKEVLEHEGVDTSGLLFDQKCFTTLAFVSLDEKGERTFSFARKPGADTQITSAEFPLDLLCQSKILHVGSLSLTDSPARETTFSALKQAKSAGVLVSYDPNYRESLWESEQTATELIRQVLPFTDLLKVSREELPLLSDFSQENKIIDFLFNCGIKLIAITDGGNGTYVYTRKGVVFEPCFDCQVKDTTGAGDSFWGAFLYKFIEGGLGFDELTPEKVQEYVRFANAAASLCIEKEGAIPALATLEDVVKRLHRR